MQLVFGNIFSKRNVVISLILVLLKVQENISCVVSPTESLAIVGTNVSIRCNARPNKEKLGSITNLKLGSDGPTGILIYQPFVYNSRGELNVNQCLADGYSLLHSDNNLFDATIQISDTRLEHGGKYFCNCAGFTSSVGTVDLIILDSKPVFEISNGGSLTEKEAVELNCSLRFNGSSASKFLDLTVLDASGKQLANRNSIQLNKNLINHVIYRVIADPSQDQTFLCETTVWVIDLSKRRTLLNLSSTLSFNWEPLSRARVTSEMQCSEVGRCFRGGRLRCEANGNPKPRFEWFQLNHNDTQPVFTAENNSSEYLTMNEFGLFTVYCRAFNTIRNYTYNVTSCNFTVKVTDSADEFRTGSVLGVGLLTGLIVACCVIVILLVIIVVMKKKSQTLSFCEDVRPKSEGTTGRPFYECMDQERRLEAHQAYSQLTPNNQPNERHQYIEVIL